jgi:hypothetical protein
MNVSKDAIEPHLRIADLSLWIYNRQFVDAQDYWDGNWLNVKARVEASGATVQAHGAILHLSELKGFAQELAVLIDKVVGTASMKCIEPNLDVSLQGDHIGHVTATISITPDHMTQTHKFIFKIDQTYLGPILASCNDVLTRFPIRGAVPT